MNDTRVYLFIYNYVQTGVIFWAEEGPKCNVMPTTIFFYFHGRMDLLGGGGAEM